MGIQRYTKKRHFLALLVSNTPKLSKDTYGGDFHAEVCMFGVPHRKHILSRHCAFQTHTHTAYPTTLLLAFLMHSYEHSARRTNNIHVLALCISNTPILSIPTHFCCQFWCRGMRVWRATLGRTIFWHRAFRTQPYRVSQETFWWHFWCRGMRTGRFTIETHFFVY